MYSLVSVLLSLLKTVKKIVFRFGKRIASIEGSQASPSCSNEDEDEYVNIVGMILIGGK